MNVLTVRKDELEGHMLLLQSDLHLDCAFTDVKAIQKEWAMAKVAGATILINGDVFDLILPADAKRFAYSAPAKNLQEDDYLNKVLDMAYEMMLPYADCIAMIGMGNHEGSVERRHSVNLIKLLIQRLNSSGANIAYGGYYGWVVLKERTGGPRGPFRIRYHHGAGGASPVTKGIIDFNRMLPMAVDADLVWVGHKHNQIWTTTARERMSVRDVVSYDVLHCVMTGGYMTRHGDPPSYAERANLPPQPLGGAFVEIERNDKEFTVGSVRFGA